MMTPEATRRYNQSRLLKTKYRVTPEPSMSNSANGYPNVHWSSGMNLKFMP